MIKHFLILLFSIFICHSQETKTICDTIDIEYDISKINVYYSPDYKFMNATFDTELNFIPNIDYYKKTFEGMNVNGKVWKKIEYKKNYRNNTKQYSGSTIFEEGYIIESDLENGSIKFFYDEQKNTTKEIIIRDTDTTQIKLIDYNEKNQIVHLIKKKNKDKNDPYNLFLTIEYDNNGNPILIKNDHPIEKYSYKTVISYDGNIVTETEFSNDDMIDIRKYWYSKDNQVLKYEHNTSYATFSEYNEKNEKIKEITFRNNEFAWINLWQHNTNGDIIRKIWSNNPKVHEMIDYYEIQYDNFNNIIYEKHTENYSEKFWENYYEYEFY